MKKLVFLLLVLFIVTGCFVPPSSSLHQILSSENAKSEPTEDPLAVKAKQTIDAMISPTPDKTNEAEQIATIVHRTLEAMKPSATNTLSPDELMATSVAGTIAALKDEIEKNSTALAGKSTATPSMVPLPTLYVLPTAQPTVPTVPVIPCDRLSFVADITVPDDTTMQPGQAFQKIWRLKNVGSCTWTPTYQFVFVNGNQMNAPAGVSIGRYVGPGETLDIGVNMVAPASPGKYSGYWRLRNDNGSLFGMGRPDVDAVWVQIKVAQEESSHPSSSYNCSVLDIKRINDSFTITGRGKFKTFQMEITLKNTGSETWSKDNVDIVYLSGSKEYFKQLRYDLPYSIAPGQSFTFSSISGGGKDPGDSGEYSSNWGLDKNGTIICTFSFIYGF